MYREPKRFLPCSEMLNSSLETRRILTASETKLLRLLFYRKHGIRVILRTRVRNLEIFIVPGWSMSFYYDVRDVLL